MLYLNLSGHDLILKKEVWHLTRKTLPNSLIFFKETYKTETIIFFYFFMLQNEKFINAFSTFGSTCDIEASVFHTLEEYICQLYGYKTCSVCEGYYKTKWLPC